MFASAVKILPEVFILDNYFKNRDFANLERINRIKTELPYFCEEFFIGIENRTTTLTRLNYAYDLRVFFQFLSNRIFKKDVLSITLDDMNSLDASDIEIFVSSLSLYEINGKREHCSERRQSEKISYSPFLF